MRILIAEDDQVLADGLLRSLRNAGYAVDQVSSGSEADAALADHEFDLVILDLGLPKVHGLEVLRRIKADDFARKIPVVVLTVSQRDDYIREALRLGAQSYIVKPVGFQNFSESASKLSFRWAMLNPAEGI